MTVWEWDLSFSAFQTWHLDRGARTRSKLNILAFQLDDRLLERRNFLSKLLIFTQTLSHALIGGSQLADVLASFRENPTLALGLVICLSLTATGIAVTVGRAIALWYYLAKLRNPVIDLVSTSTLDLVVRCSSPVVPLNAQNKTKQIKLFDRSSNLKKNVKTNRVFASFRETENSIEIIFFFFTQTTRTFFTPGPELRGVSICMVANLGEIDLDVWAVVKTSLALPMT